MFDTLGQPCLELTAHPLPSPAHKPMSHTLHDIPDAGIGKITLPHSRHSHLPPASTDDGHLYPPPSVPAQAPQVVPNFSDGSGHIFSMYLDMAKEEDTKMTDNWKADADGILIFVRLSSDLVLHTDSIVIDRFILCRCCVVAFGVDSRYSTEPTGHLELLPREHL